MLVTLEALRKELNEVAKEMADIEVYIYGNSKDVHDNYGEIDSNGNSTQGNRHTLQGMISRVSGLADQCRHN